MDSSSSKYGNSLQRHLSGLKLVSRLLGHEMHSQGGAKTITLSREEVLEIQSTIDLFIEETSRRGGGLSGNAAGSGSARPVANVDTQLVPARN